MPNHRLTELDALRGFAAFAVVIYHMVYRYADLYGHEDIATYWAYWGQYGVHLFFMISGYVIYWTLDRIQRPAEFVISRFSRLYPVYWVSVLVTFTAVFAFGLADRQVHVSDMMLNLLMFHEYLGVPHVDGVYWTLTLELTFYAWMFTLLLSKQQRNAPWLLILLIALNAALQVFSLEIRFLELLTLDGYAQFFLLGIAVFNWQSERDRLSTRVAFAVVFVACLFATNWLETILYGFLSALFIGAVKVRMALLRHSIFVWLGAISYSLYLIHQNIGYVILNYLPNNWSSVLKVSVATMMVIAIAYGLNRLIEVPSNRAFKKRLQARFLRGKASAS
ncbi:acyltransferase family protein [Alteromonas facilis]|uniref:acyltransferase family protein n=1 Tax=Alteromonas facilis TaxID=2048004 RepID=UPI000C292F9B|nr:acyltransferase [Alteromonas facilis]